MSTEIAIQPVLCTDDIERLRSFYVELLGAEEHLRVPGPDGTFMMELRAGDAGLGLVAHKEGAEKPTGRVIVAVFVENVDAVVARVEPAGGTVRRAGKDMPWGHRVGTSRTRTATRSTSPSASESLGRSGLGTAWSSETGA